MVRPAPQRVLLVGDAERQVHAPLAQALPGTQVISVGSAFDAIAELASGTFMAVVAAAEPIERRPEAAVRVLRELAGDARLLLFGHPTLEMLARKMLHFGADDYIVTPASAQELSQAFGSDAPRHSARVRVETTSAPTEEPASPASRIAAAIEGLLLGDFALEALLQHPHDAPAAAIVEMNARIAPAATIVFTRKQQPAPAVEQAVALLSQPVRNQQEELGALHLTLPADEEASAARHALAQLSSAFGKLVALQERHNLLQRLAITDELTGLYNARYFRHFLSRIIERGKAMRFPVSLLLFDIDDFKKYNDQFGHGVGDEILKQTSLMMKRCCRDHDLVARIGGDEFAVVFWEKEGPRQPREPKPIGPSRAPQAPIEIFNRFKRLIDTTDFAGLGSSGRGTLGISGGMAVYPYDAPDAEALIKAADEALMFGAKQGGKNSIYLVGGADDPPRAAAR